MPGTSPPPPPSRRLFRPLRPAARRSRPRLDSLTGNMSRSTVLGVEGLVAGAAPPRATPCPLSNVPLRVRRQSFPIVSGGHCQNPRRVQMKTAKVCFTSTGLQACAKNSQSVRMHLYPDLSEPPPKIWSGSPIRPIRGLGKGLAEASKVSAAGVPVRPAPVGLSNRFSR